jgi:hypothetical protein
MGSLKQHWWNFLADMHMKIVTDWMLGRYGESQYWCCRVWSGDARRVWFLEHSSKCKTQGKLPVPAITDWCHMSMIFRDITPCSPLKVNRCVGGTYRLHLQGIRRLCLPSTSMLASWMNKWMNKGRPKSAHALRPHLDLLCIPFYFTLPTALHFEWSVVSDVWGRHGSHLVP